MPRIAVNFHRGQGPVSRLIRWQTRGRVNHVSLHFIDDDLVVEADGALGVVARSSGARPYTDLFARFERDVSEARYRAAKALYFSEMHGRKYDWVAVLRFVSRRRQTERSERRWFCSELAVRLLRMCGFTPLLHVEDWRVDPERLFQSPIWTGWTCVVRPPAGVRAPAGALPA